MYHSGGWTSEDTFTDFVASTGHRGHPDAQCPLVPGDPARRWRTAWRSARERHGSIRRHLSASSSAPRSRTNAILERSGGRTALIATPAPVTSSDPAAVAAPPFRPRPPEAGAAGPRAGAGRRRSASGPTGRSSPRSRCEAAGCGGGGGLGVESVRVVSSSRSSAPGHERRLREALAREAPPPRVALVDRDAGVPRVQRTCTTVMNAYVMPKVHRLVERLDAELSSAGPRAPLRIMQSNGGLMGASRRAPSRSAPSCRGRPAASWGRSPSPARRAPRRHHHRHGR